MKNLLYILPVLTLFFAAPAEANKEIEGHNAPVSLRENIVVSGQYIRLNDFFDNAPIDVADTAIAYSPKPGRKATFDARWLFRVARAYGLQWRPLSADLRASVKRDSIVIQREEIMDSLMEALVDYDIPENPKVEISNRNLRIHVPSEIMPVVTVEDVSFNNRTKRFAVIMNVGEEGASSQQRFRVTGQVHEMLDIPTLNRRLAKGEVIRHDDISWLKLRADRAQRDVIVNVEELIGMTPRRHLRADVPVRRADVQMPNLVEKGKIVTIILKKPGMSLTSQGRALQNGADGETVKVSNTSTRRTIEAVVVGTNVVTVLPASSKAAQLAYNR